MDMTQDLSELISSSEEWLMERILTYAKTQGYSKYTSTLQEAWRLAISGLSISLLNLLETDGTDLELGPDDDFANDPAAAFGVIEAKRHRERGINLGMFLGLMKYYRETYKNLVKASGFKTTAKEYSLHVVERFFDRVEIGFCVEWTTSTDNKTTSELQSTNRIMTNEKNKLEAFARFKSKEHSFEKEIKTTRDLKRNVKELEQANRKILEQQTVRIEEERLKVLLQMAGATAHELNQPLMALLGNIELMSWEKNDPVKVLKRALKIEKAGNRIANIVKKIQTIRHYEVKSYAGNSEILNLNQKINILSVDKSDKDYKEIEEMLKKQTQIMLTRARDMDEALDVLQNTSVDLIFLDYVLPTGNGLDFLRKIQEKEIDTPVIFITANGDEMVASQAINCGAYDYLPKANLSEQALQKIINNALEKYRLKKEVKTTMETMAEMSTRDELTGLYNRRYFMEVFDRETAGAQRYDTELVLCMMDLDHFKKINDTYGHPAGDEVLKEIAYLLRKTVRKSDVACRYGGEEFAVILPNTDIEHAAIFCERFRKEVEKHAVQYNGSNLRITISSGVAQFSDSVKGSEKPFDALIKKADHSLYLAKSKGRNRVVCEGRDMPESSQ